MEDFNIEQFLSLDGYNTEEPIPDFCITCLDLNTWKEIIPKQYENN